MDRVRIEWRNRQAYDDWDRIAEVLFDEIVVNSVRHAEEVAELGAVFLRYDWIDASLSREGRVLAVGEDGQGRYSLKRGIFKRFGTRDEAFDTVVIEVVDDGGSIQRREHIPESETTFVAEVWQVDHWAVLDDLHVAL